MAWLASIEKLLLYCCRNRNSRSHIDIFFTVSPSTDVNANISDMFSRNGLKINTHHGLMDQDM